MKKIMFIISVLFLFSGCVHTPYASVGASKSINVGGVNVGVGVHDILRLGK